MEKRVSRSPGAPREAVSMLPEAAWRVSVLLEAEKNAEPKVGTDPVLGDAGVVLPPELEAW
jgi:hypothetical protein